MVKQVSELVGRVEKLERAPEHDAARDSAEAASALHDLNKLQHDHKELQRKFEGVNETVNSMAERLLDAEQR
eukprot:8769073-Lingulodinium_polyedra.AAC.1